MKILSIAWANIKGNSSAIHANIILLSISIMLASLLSLIDGQMLGQFKNKSTGYNLTITGNGSQLENNLATTLLLNKPKSSFNVSDAKDTLPLNAIKNLAPIIVDTTYLNHRLVATTSRYFSMHRVTIRTGGLWTNTNQAVLGAQTAKSTGLKVGDVFYPYNDLDAKNTGPKFVVVGILNQSDYSLNNAIFVNLKTFWDFKEESMINTSNVVDDDNPNESESTKDDKQVSALLILARDNDAISEIHESLEKNPEMQIVSPNFASGKILYHFSLFKHVLNIIIITLFLIASINLYFSITHQIKKRKFEFTLLRLSGATKTNIFFIIITESLFISLIASKIGIILSHLLLILLSSKFIFSTYLQIDPFYGSYNELYTALTAILITLAFSIKPAIDAAQTNILKVTSKF